MEYIKFLSNLMVFRMIEGVKTKNLRVIPDERGWLMEILRCDEDLFEKFGQVYISTAYPEVVKAWHLHRKQKDNFTCINGMVKVVLYDVRKNSPTHGELNEFFIGEKNPLLISIPPNVYHGYKAIGKDTAFCLNVPNNPYKYVEPDEFRLTPDTDEIPYDWILNGKKHG